MDQILLVLEVLMQTHSRQGFTHPAAHREIRWDLRQTSKLRNVVNYVKNESDREKIKHFISLFEVIQPQLDRMRMSVIHGDANEHNILISNDTPAGIFLSWSLFWPLGIIDFADFVYTNTICELAILMMYCMIYQEDPMKAACNILIGYNESFRVTDNELEVGIW